MHHQHRLPSAMASSVSEVAREMQRASHMPQYMSEDQQDNLQEQATVMAGIFIHSDFKYYLVLHFKSSSFQTN